VGAYSPTTAARSGALDGVGSPGFHQNALTLLKPYPPEKMECYDVSPLVNNPRNDLPECVRPLNFIDE
jgi:putative SOS response-associated peptidase YedK